MSSIRVYALAKEYGLASKDLVAILNDIGIDVTSHMSTLTEEQQAQFKRHIDNEVNKNVQKNKVDAPVDRDSGASDKTENPTEDNKPPTKSSNHKNSSKKAARREQVDEEEDEIISHKNRKQRRDKKTKPAKQKKSKSQIRRENREARELEEQAKGDGHIVRIQVPITVKEFAEAIGINVSEVIKKLIGLGIMANQNESIDEDVATLLAADFDKEIEFGEEESSVEEAEMDLDFEDSPESLKPRSPVITVMGHVDHGKTSLLDAIKQTQVTSSEAGGITQHIGAYTVESNGHMLTFLDTPGHEAFTSMRSRGASITDIAILVVAADDGVMPQTVEAINHAKVADVPIIVAINKIDREGANPDRVKQELTEQGLVPEDWGGETIMVEVSAKTGEGIDNLLEMIQLLAEILELKANPDRLAVGTVIEAKLDKGKGPMATILVQKGTLKFGDYIVSGTSYGHIRAMTNDKKKRIGQAGPSMPAVILGLNDVPNAGDRFYAVDDERKARNFAQINLENEREEKLASQNKVSLDNLFDKIKEGELKDLNIIVKADVKGTVEALSQSLEKIKSDEVKINIIHAAAGGINESDISLAAASDALVIGFNVRPNMNALDLAKQEGVDVRTYRVIYDILEDVKAAVSGMLEPTIVEEILGRCEVREIFKIPNKQIAAGIYVLKGKITRNGLVKVLRDDIVIHEGPLGSLKRFQDDAKEITQGFEGGLTLENYNDIKVGDVLECYVEKEVRKEL